MKDKNFLIKLPQGHTDSEYGLSFEIGQREGGFYSGRTDLQNHPVLYSNIDDYESSNVIKFVSY